MKQHVRKHYKPSELRDAIAVLKGVGVANPESVVTALHSRGWRILYAGKIVGERSNATSTSPTA